MMKRTWRAGIVMASLGLVACNGTAGSGSTSSASSSETDHDSLSATGSESDQRDTADTNTSTAQTASDTETQAPSVSTDDSLGTETPLATDGSASVDSESQVESETDSATGGGWPGNTEQPSIVLQLGSAQGDYCNALVVGDEAIYVAGATRGTVGDTANPSTRLDFFVAKLDFELNVEWIRQRGSAADELGRAVALDSAGNVYVAGTTWGSLDEKDNPSPGSGDVFVARFDDEGQWQWTSTWPTTADDYTYGLTVSGSSVYVTTFSDLEKGYVKKFGTNGSGAWARTVNVGLADVPQAVAVDSSGNVYAAGHSFASFDEGDAEAFVVHFNAAGQKQNELVFGTLDRDEIRGMVYDSSTSTLVVGGLAGGALPGNVFGGDGDAFVARVSTSLELEWASQLGGEAFDQTHGVAIGPDGNLFATGTVDSVFIPDDVHGDAFVARFLGSGQSEWMETWKSDGEDYANAVAATAEHVFVCATTNGTLGEDNLGGADVAVMRLDLE